MPRTCTACGHPIERKSIKGEPPRMYSMFIPVDCEILLPTCTGCGAQFIGKKEANAIHDRLFPIYMSNLRIQAKKLLESIESQSGDASKSRWLLTCLLGLPTFTLGKTARGKEQPNATLVAALALIAGDPITCIDKLEEFWGVGDLDERYEKMREEWGKDSYPGREHHE